MLRCDTGERVRQVECIWLLVTSQRRAANRVAIRSPRFTCGTCAGEANGTCGCRCEEVRWGVILSDWDVCWPCWLFWRFLGSNRFRGVQVSGLKQTGLLCCSDLIFKPKRVAVCAVPSTFEACADGAPEQTGACSDQLPVLVCTWATGDVGPGSEAPTRT